MEPFPGQANSDPSAALPAEEILPSGIPEALRPEGASEWRSGGEPLETVIPLPSDYQQEPAMSSAVQAINQGLLHESCTQLDGYGPELISAQVDGFNQIVGAARFASGADYLRWLKDLVGKSQGHVRWEDIERERMGVLELPGGEQLCIFLDTPARGWPTFSLRKHSARSWESSSFVQRKTLTGPMLEFLQCLVGAHVNMLIVGPMGAGKTTLLRSLAETSISDDEKIAVVEQVPELQINKPFAVEYIYQPTRPGLQLADILDYNLYNGLSRLIVGEVHLEGLTKMLETMILTEGSMSTYHAYSVSQAVERMKMALQIEHTNINGATAANFIRQAVEAIVVIEKIDGVRRVTQIAEVDWRGSFGQDSLACRDIFRWENDRHRAQGVEPDRTADGRITMKLRKYGIEIDRNWFFEKEHIQRAMQSQR